jgi:hypothetical protein
LTNWGESWCQSRPYKTINNPGTSVPSTRVPSPT